MSRQLQITTERLWKLGSIALLLLSFTFSGWILGNAVNAVVHLIDALVDFLQTNMSFLDTYEYRLLAG